ncbi:MAG: YceI family protein, partial [Chloroflexota bacterium]
VTLEVKFEGGLIDPWGKPRIAFSASAEIDREEWGVSWNVPLAAGGIMVGKTVTLMIDAQATLS